MTAQPDMHKGWSISFVHPPIPWRDADWSATHPQYDVWTDDFGNSYDNGFVVQAESRDALIAKIDAWDDEADV